MGCCLAAALISDFSSAAKCTTSKATTAFLANIAKGEEDSAEEMALLTTHRRVWPFWGYVLTNVESSLASADPELMDLYADLVEDEALRRRFKTQFRAEWDSTHLSLEQLRGKSLENSRPRMLKTLSLRSEALRVLHHQQVGLLREWRGRIHSGNIPSADALLPELLLSINAIASGLRTPG
jgi:phosphoenolpyruvate carboxylase